jgi:hypothetical protein
VELPAEYAQLYRADALFMSGLRSPIQQQHVAKPNLPKGPTPRIGSAEIQRNGGFRLVERMMSTSHFDSAFPDQPGVAGHVYQYVATAVTRDIATDRVRVWRPDGTSVPAADLATLLKQQTPVVVSADGTRVDPFFLGLLKPESLVIGFPLGKSLPGLSAPPPVQ